MERPIIIWLKDDGKITKETLEEVARKAYEQGYEDGKNVPWYVRGRDYITTTNPKDIYVKWTSSDTAVPPYYG